MAKREKETKILNLNNVKFSFKTPAQKRNKFLNLGHMILACSFSVSDLEDKWYQHKQLCRKTYFLSYLCRQEL